MTNLKISVLNKIFPVIAVLLLSGCVAPAVKRVRSEYWSRQLTENAITTGEISEHTATYLSLRGWEGRQLRRPEPILKELRKQLLRNPDRAGLTSFSELAYMAGDQTKDDTLKERYLLTAARAAYAVMFDKQMGAILDALDPNLRFAADLYNYSLSQLVDHLLDAKSTSLDKQQLALIEGQLNLSKGHGAADAAAFTETLIAFFYKTDALRLHNRRRGLGVPVVAVRTPEFLVKGQGLFYPPVHQTSITPATLLLRFREPWRAEGDHLSATTELWNPLITTHVEIEGKRIPLEADTSLALALLYDRGSQYRGLLKMPGLLRSKSVTKNRGLILLEPYSHDKIPVILTHGLMDSPLTWVPMLNALLTDPVLNERYQFWMFFYPTMNPILHSASELRLSLLALHERVGADDSEWDNMVLIGHSMGGLITRLLITPSNKQFQELEQHSLERSEDDAEIQEYLRSLTEFTPLPFAKRAVFIGTPHRGAKMVKRPMGIVGQSIISRPTYIRKFIDKKEGRKKHMDKLDNGIANLATDSLFTLALNESTWDPAVHVHSLIGDHDRAGSTNGTDKVVAYWSSHVEGVDSELIVQSDHLTLHKKTPAISEVRRILMEHLTSLQ